MSDCHVYIVSRTVLPAEKPAGDCHVCGLPLRDHAKQTSSLVLRDRAYIIDELPLRESHSQPTPEERP